MTNYWEHAFGGKGLDEAGELEEQQGANLAKAAANTATLEHYIWSTLPSAKKLSDGKIPVPHWSVSCPSPDPCPSSHQVEVIANARVGSRDYKANVDDYIKSQQPDLAAKTTYLSVGYYPQNMAYFPQIKPLEIVSRWSPCHHHLHVWLWLTKV